MSGVLAQEVATTCPYCGVGCGVRVGRDADGAYRVRGDTSHPANYGRLCSKGAALAETIGIDGRLLHPEVDGVSVSWNSALDRVSEDFARVIDEHGPDAVAFYVSGQLLTEDYYVANKLMKGFIGSANIDTNSRLCMSSAVAAHKRAFGSDTVPMNYTDLEQADLVVLAGSNLAWCHPVLNQRLLAARKQRPVMQLVVIDPRVTPSCDGADLHLALKSGTDAYLFNGLLAWLHGQGEGDDEFLARYTGGAEAALEVALAHAPSVKVVAAHCDLDEEQVRQFYQLFSRTEKVVTLFSQGINQSARGTDKGNAIINCHLYSGRIGRAGMGPFSITGQPNAMGGREVGGLANQLAAHMDIDNPDHRRWVSEFWQTDNLAPGAGLKAVELFDALESGRVRALWIMGTNPAVSLPDGNRMRRALSRCELLVVSDCVASNDTLSFAQVKLPAQTWGEKSGTVTNSERRISRQRAFLDAPGEAQPDWWALCQVARRLGYNGFDFEHPADIFNEHARLSAYRNDGERDFDLSGLVDLEPQDYDDLKPVQWPCTTGGAVNRLFADGRFFTPDHRARLVPVQPHPPALLPDEYYPLVLNTGRVRDHWHSMTRTGMSPRLSGHVKEPCISLHPDDAEQVSLVHGALARVESRHGEALLRVDISGGLRRGEVFVPMHWNDEYAASAAVGRLVNPAVDPVSGQPEFKHTPVRVSAYQAAWYGFLLSRRPMHVSHANYWCKARRQDHWQYELAGDDLPPDWAHFARDLLCEANSQPQWFELHDSTQANYRAARITDGRLDAVLIVQPALHLPPRDWLSQLFGKVAIESAERRCLLSGLPPKGQQNTGAVVCSCFGIGVNTLRRAIREHQLASPEAIGELLNAGTNCGSCVPELRRLIADDAHQALAG